MNGVSPVELFLAGAGALLTPALILPAMGVGVAGLCTGARRRWGHHLLVAGLLVLVVGVGLARRGALPLDDMAGYLAGGVSLVLFDLARREDQVHLGRLVLWGLLLGLGVVLLRTPLLGPVLGAVGGSWESVPGFLPGLLYHLGSAVAVAGLYLALAAMGAKLVSPTLGGRLGLVVVLILVAAAATGQLTAGVHQLLLRWPVTGLG